MGQAQIAPFGLNLPFHYPSAPLGMDISMLLMTSDLSPSGHGGETRGSLYGHPDSGVHRDVTLRCSSTDVFHGSSLESCNKSW